MRPCGRGLAGVRLHDLACLRLQQMLDVSAKYKQSKAWHALIFLLPLSDVTQQSKGHTLLSAWHTYGCMLQGLSISMANGKRKYNLGTDGHANAGMVVLMPPLTMNTATCQARR